jgi:hypothetical protein
MKIRYLGTTVVDVHGHVDVEHGQTIDVPTDVANQLLLAGSSISEGPDGEQVVTPPAEPLWEPATKTAKGDPKVTQPETEEV